jgi:hypothetical protein
LHFLELALLIFFNLGHVQSESTRTISKARVHVVDTSTILSEAGILERVLSFLPGHWLYLGGVCRAWMQSYKRMKSCDIHGISAYMRDRAIACDWSTTLMEAVFQSPSRVKLAVASDLKWYRDGKSSFEIKLQYHAGLYADVPTLSMAEELGLALSGATVSGAAKSGRVSTVNYLIQERDCELPLDAETVAAKNGDIDMLECLKQNGLVFTGDTCSSAAAAGQLPTLKYVMSALECTCELLPDATCGPCDWIGDGSLHDAVKSGNIEMVKWLQQHYGVRIDGFAAMSAADDDDAMRTYLHYEQHWKDIPSSPPYDANSPAYIPAMFETASDT